MRKTASHQVFVLSRSGINCLVFYWFYFFVCSFVLFIGLLPQCADKSDTTCLGIGADYPPRIIRSFPSRRKTVPFISKPIKIKDTMKKYMRYAPKNVIFYCSLMQAKMQQCCCLSTWVRSSTLFWFLATLDTSHPPGSVFLAQSLSSAPPSLPFHLLGQDLHAHGSTLSLSQRIFAFLVGMLEGSLSFLVVRGGITK